MKGTTMRKFIKVGIVVVVLAAAGLTASQCDGMQGMLEDMMEQFQQQQGGPDEEQSQTPEDSEDDF